MAQWKLGRNPPKTPSPASTMTTVDEDMARLIQRAKLGEISNRDIEAFVRKWKSVSWRDTRQKFEGTVSDAVYSIEWINSMLRLLSGKRVLELPLGTSFVSWLFKTKFRAHDVQWINPGFKGRGTISNAQVIDPHPHPIDLVDKIQPDVLFLRKNQAWSDYHLGYASAIAEVPTLFVREPRVTLSTKLWNNRLKPPHEQTHGFDYYLEPIADSFDWFEDVPNWKMSDQKTFILLPAGAGIVIDGRIIAGPPKEKRKWP